MQSPTGSAARVGEQVPAFELTDLDGRVWTAADFSGQPTVLFCFASWCTCKEQLPSWHKYWDSRGRDFQMVAGIGLKRWL